MDENNIALIQGQGDGGGGNVSRGMERIKGTEIVVENGSGGIKSSIHGVIGETVDIHIGGVFQGHVVVAFLGAVGGHGRRETTMYFLLLRVETRRCRARPRSDGRKGLAFGDF